MSFAAMGDAANSLRIELRPLAREQDPNETSENKKWDVSNPPGPADIVHLDMSLVADGQIGIEHCIPVGKAYDDVIQFFSAIGTGITPTLIVGYGGIWGENYWYRHTNLV